MVRGVEIKLLDKTGAIAVGAAVDAIKPGIKGWFARLRARCVVRRYLFKAHNVTLPGGGQSLAERLSSRGRVDEFIERCAIGDLTRQQTVGLLLYDDKEAFGINERAEALANEVFDAVHATLHGLTQPIGPASSGSVNAVLVQARSNDVKLDRVLEELQRGTSPQTEIAALERIIVEVEKGEMTVVDLQDLADRCDKADLSFCYLRCYVSFCEERDECQSVDLTNLSIRLLCSLASVAYSAGFSDRAADILQICADGEGFANALRKIGDVAPTIALISDEGIDVKSPYYLLLKTINAETSMRNRALLEANDMYAQCDELLNPIARMHWKLARQAKMAHYSSEPMDIDSIAEFIQCLPAWSGARMRAEWLQIASMSLYLLDGETGKAIIDGAPAFAKELLREDALRFDMRSTFDGESLLQLRETALEEGFVELYCETTERLLELDPGMLSIEVRDVEKWEKISYASYIGFLYYIDHINVGIEYADFMRIGHSHENDVGFHLRAYELVSTSDFEIAQYHIERALDMMKRRDDPLCIDKCETWIRYLLDNGRGKEMLALLEPYVGVLSARNSERIIRAIGIGEESAEALRGFLSLLESAGLGDPKLLSLVARCYCLPICENRLKAVSLAQRSFDIHPCKQSAYILMECMVILRMNIPAEVRSIAMQANDTSFDILLAEDLDRRGNLVERDRYLLRGILRGDAESTRALISYGYHHIGVRERMDPNMIKAGIVAYVRNEQTEEEMVFAFHEGSEALSSEGTQLYGALHFSDRSHVFLSMKDAVVGDCVCYSGSNLRIRDLITIEAFFCRKYLERLVEMPGTVALHADPNHPEDGLELLKKEIIDRSKPMDAQVITFLEGIEIDESNTLYLGLETGASLFGVCTLEFILGVTEGRSLPFRRYPLAKTAGIGPDARFLLSYNAVILISLLEDNGCDIGPLFDVCEITASTRNEIDADVRIMMGIAEGDGRVLVKDGEIYREVYDEDAIKHVRATCAGILRVLDGLRCVEPTVCGGSFSEMGFLRSGTAIDLETAEKRGDVYVTEDIMHAQLLQLLGSPPRCSVYMLFILAGVERALFLLGDSFRKWGADPFVDYEISAIIRDLFADSDKGDDSFSSKMA